MTDWLENQLREACELFARVRDDAASKKDLGAIAEAVVHCLRGGGKILTCGNGGSCADASHLAEELVGRYRGDRPAQPAVCLAADAAALTCIANDFGFERVFARQVEALCRPGDLLVAFSTSGRSPNIIAALKAVRAAGGRTVGLLGGDGGPARADCDLAFIVPHTDSARIQEAHTLALHIICEAVERAIA